mmetsp:Transcript_1189/g.3065  ORF Transcript_1189/g.3065 Transcript_1189/m.3065 type:complete len:239 (+) Transcript_1189:154-870(+)
MMCQGLARDGRYQITIVWGLLQVIFDFPSFVGISIGSHDGVHHDVATNWTHDQGCDTVIGMMVSTGGSGTSKMQLQEFDLVLDIFHEFLHGFTCPVICRPFHNFLFLYVQCVQCRLSRCIIHLECRQTFCVLHLECFVSGFILILQCSSPVLVFRLDGFLLLLLLLCELQKQSPCFHFSFHLVLQRYFLFFMHSPQFFLVLFVLCLQCLHFFAIRSPQCLLFHSVVIVVTCRHFLDPH